MNGIDYTIESMWWIKNEPSTYHISDCGIEEAELRSYIQRFIIKVDLVDYELAIYSKLNSASWDSITDHYEWILWLNV